MAVTLRVTGVRQEQARLKKLAERLQREVNAEVEAAGQEYVKRAKQTLSNNNRGNDEGTLLASINYEKLITGQVNVQAQAAHALYIEFGTRGNYRPQPGVDASAFRTQPNKGRGGFYDAILRWVKRNKISGTYSVKTRRRTGSKVDQQIEDEQTAFAIYMYIIRHGIKPAPFFFQHQEPIRNLLERNIQNLVNALEL